ncbi:hypothetical protein N7462_000493 [Penicillium macrosclerotiorum]|uniref:uncharacterized protein n=1 Tax=Penicillium macrosclerotiorum TaxID=303699 RepID=UPI002547A121|nr:uncharacterized protein N7462_000493 [Penicillium macrosclerotiorum]KAJ5698488.1 hypothetical protein N7462_000493 [Penicillium macrosclerotiorum]
MRYTLINGLLLLGISPLTSLALPVDPNDQGGVWDPSGQYRKGHYDSNGDFIPNEQGQVGWNENGQNWQNGQNYQNSQNGYYDQNGQWRSNTWNQNNNNNNNNNNNWNQNGQNGQYNRWQRRSLPGQPLNAEELRNHGNLGVPGVGLPGVGVPGVGIHARNWPYDGNNQGGWTDTNGQWHSNNNNQNSQAGWTDANGVWHSTDYSQGWTDANGIWHQNPNTQNQNNQGGWTDANGQWHANQKRGLQPTPANLADPNVLNQAQAAASLNDATRVAHVPRHYPNDRYDEYEREREQDREEDRETALDVASAIIPRWWPFTDSNWNRNDNWDSNNNCDRNDWNCRNRYNDKCKNGDWNDRSGWSCRSDWSRPTPSARVYARNYPQDQNNWNNNNNHQDYPQATSSVNYKNEHQDKDLKVTGGEQE